MRTPQRRDAVSHVATLVIRMGTLTLERLHLTLQEGFRPRTAEASLPEKPALHVTLHLDPHSSTVDLEFPVALKLLPGQRLTFTLK